MTKDPYNPNHYTSREIESIDVVEEFFRLDSHLATSYAYLHRAGLKEENPPEQDYRKALWWLDRALECHPAGGYTGGSRSLINRVNNTRQLVFKDRPRIGEAFLQMAMAMATGDAAPYKRSVRDAIGWIQAEIEELESDKTSEGRD